MQSSGTSSPETGRPQPSRSTSTLTRKRFALTGRSLSHDPRIEAARGDLADVRLAERVFAPHYAAATRRTVVRRAPLLVSSHGAALSEVLVGEPFDVLEFSADHAWGVSPVDGAVGFVPMDALDVATAMTHIVRVREEAGLPMGSRIADPEGFDPQTIASLDAFVADHVAVAEAMIGVPAVPGGRSGAGVDPAGLVFLAMSLAGVRVPRFRDLQEVQLGHAVDADAPMLRGDVLFFADHVALAVDDADAIHVAATGVVREPVAALVTGPAGSVKVRRRLP